MGADLMGADVMSADSMGAARMGSVRRRPSVLLTAGPATAAALSPQAGPEHPERSERERPDKRRAHLEVVTTRAQRRARPRVLYAIIAVSALLLIVVTQLLLSIGISQGAYELNSAQAQQIRLQRAHQVVAEDLNRLTSPQNLAANANALGMVSDSAPAYLRLSDGAVLGAPAPASGAAGTVTGGQGNLVPNSQLKDVPLVTAPPAESATAERNPAGEPEGSAGAAAPAPTAPAPLKDALPTPVTH